MCGCLIALRMAMGVMLLGLWWRYGDGPEVEREAQIAVPIVRVSGAPEPG